MIKHLVIKESSLLETKELYHHWNSFETNGVDPIKLNHIGVAHIFPTKLTVKDPLVIGAYYHTQLIGCCSLFPRKYEHLYIGGIGKMAVDYKYRYNNVSTELLLYLKNIMGHMNFDISLLWASVLKVYEKVGYKAYYRNMMALPIKKEITIDMLLNLKELPERIGAW